MIWWKRPLKLLKMQKRLGASYVRVAWIPHEGPATIETIKKAAEDFNKAGKFLEGES